MQIDNPLITYLEDLSCLILSPDEKYRLTVDLEKILNDMERLGEVDTVGVSESSHPFDHVNAFRNDDVHASLGRKLVLKNAPRKNDEMFLAPKTVE